ncbi:MAG TPA: PD-(D/E)XK nuclease family protein [Solirubrobacteraceae bacterium]|nr:PD-(D/E)XK nuclease family protein [Solirubrobacteraceae bacterium]
MSVSRTAPELAADGGAPGFLRRAEVRDVLAWVRLLVDPQDAAAVVRALARPPIELRQTHLARVIQVARRRKLDLVSGLTAASESPQVPPEARERIERFVAVHRSAAGALDSLSPDAFIAELIELLGTRGRALLAPAEVATREASLSGLRELTVAFTRADPEATPRELARHLAAVVPRARAAAGPPESTRPREHAPAATEMAAALLDDTGAGEAGGARTTAADIAATELAAQASAGQEHLEASYQLLREEVLDSVARIGGHLGELRLDTELDISHGVVRYLELVKLAALLQRPAGQDLAEALADVNARLLAATTPVQREIFQTSPLDEALTARSQVEGREEHSLEPFLPRKGVGLALSASDIETYRSCPLRYKFARVLRIPTEQTPHQRFGIVVHQVLERFHCDGAKTREQMHALLDAGWRRAGFGDSEDERELLEKARRALDRYHERLGEQRSEPVWFERSFSFRLGPHHLRGRVDRVDRILGDGAGAGAEPAEEQYELIDYKTSRPKSADQLEDDVQLSLYALAAREDWGLRSSRQAYYYVLDDLKVPVPRGAHDEASVQELVLEVGEGILAQRFEPTPSQAACSICDYRIVCPVAER